jgi:hypothetical protein
MTRMDSTQVTAQTGRARLAQMLAEGQTAWPFVADMAAVIDTAGSDVVTMARAALAGVYARSFAADCPSDLPAVMVRVGLTDRALAQAEHIHEPVARTAAFTAVGQALWRAGDRERAVAAITRPAAGEHPSRAATAVDTLLELGADAEALAVAATIDPTGPAAPPHLIRVAEMFARHGHLDGAWQTIRRIHNGPWRERARIRVALALADIGSYDEAWAAAEELRPQESDDPGRFEVGREKTSALAWLSVMLADVQPDASTELLTAAEECLRRTVDTGPDATLSRVALCAARTRAGRFDEAVQLITQHPPVPEPTHPVKNPWTDLTWSGIYWRDGGVWHANSAKRRGAAAAARQAVATGTVEQLLAAADALDPDGTVPDLLRAAAAIESARAGRVAAARLHAATVQAIQGQVETTFAIASALMAEPHHVRPMVANLVARAPEAERADGHLGSAADVIRRAAVLLARAGDVDAALGLPLALAGLGITAFRDILAASTDAGHLADVLTWDPNVYHLQKLVRDTPAATRQALRAAAADTPAPLIRAVAAATDESTVDELGPAFDRLGADRGPALVKTAENLLAAGRPELARRVVLHAVNHVPSRPGPTLAYDQELARWLARAGHLDRALDRSRRLGHGGRIRAQDLARVVLGLAERPDLDAAARLLADVDDSGATSGELASRPEATADAGADSGTEGAYRDALLVEVAGLLHRYGLLDAARRLLGPFGGAAENDTASWHEFEKSALDRAAGAKSAVDRSLEEAATRVRILATSAAAPVQPRDEVIRILHTVLRTTLEWGRSEYFFYIMCAALPAIATLDDGALLPDLTDTIDQVVADWQS